MPVPACFVVFLEVWWIIVFKKQDDQSGRDWPWAHRQIALETSADGSSFGDTVPIVSTLYSEGSFVWRFYIPKPFEVAMLRRTCGPRVLCSEVHLVRMLLWSEDSMIRKALHHMDSMLRRFFNHKFT